MELVNYQFDILHGSRTISTGPTSSLIDTSNVFISDPQVMWDPSTSRFYFSMFENRGSSGPDEGIAWGFSKTRSPNSPSDFCTYFNGFNYGSSSFPDLNSLGDTTRFLLIGSDRYTTSNENFVGSDVAWISKPPSGKSCPTQNSFTTGIKSLMNPDGMTFPYRPVPTRQTDSSDTGWVVAVPSFTSASSLTLYRVTDDPGGVGITVDAPTSVPVAPYADPPSAPQGGKTTSGASAPNLQTGIYLSQCYSAFDPRLGHLALWTADTVAGGAGAEVRWYEINPSAGRLDRVGTVSDPNLYVFNGTIAPDRMVNGTRTAFGADAVINVNTSSSTADAAIQISSTVEGHPVSPLRLIMQSPGPDIDFTCTEPGFGYCRWGDYSGASPDPNGSMRGTVGRVWLSNEWNVASTNDSNVVWRTLLLDVRA